jgi:hypothetical protein
VNPRPSQSGQLGLYLAARGFGGQYIVYSGRPYPGFDTTRLLNGSADADSSDAPLVPVAIGALSYLYRNLAESGDSGKASQYNANADKYQRAFYDLAGQHTVVDQPSQGGRGLPRTFSPPVFRSGVG